MTFYADKQTTDDLNLLDWYRSNSVAHLFNRVATAGGKRLLEQMFRQPFTDHLQINTRSNLFRFFTGLQVAFPFNAQEMEVVEAYLSSPAQSSRLQTGWDVLSRKVMKAAVNDKAFEQLQEQVATTISVVQRFYQWLPVLDHGAATPYAATLVKLQQALADKRLDALLAVQTTTFSVRQLAAYDFLLRTGLQTTMEAIRNAITELDVYLAVAGVARQRQFSFAKALPRAAGDLRLEGLRHPCLESAVSNDLHFDTSRNVLFLTGANMAGKSTLMKAFGCCMYLAHMGFPVPATYMEFSVKDGLYTSINVPDNINFGYSHFYAEVLRVKQVAESVAGGRNMIVIFDELFKGTNVKDAYDATLAVTTAFASYSNCLFMVSTHIIEAGMALQADCPGCWFAYLPTVMDGKTPVYTYRLQPGITADKQGMIIIEQERVVEIILEGRDID